MRLKKRGIGADPDPQARPPAAPRYEACDPRVQPLIEAYVRRLALPTEALWVTSDRAVFGRWLGRRVPAAYGGAYVFLQRQRIHAVLINLERIDLGSPKALEIVVAEELVHMRDHLDGDYRRHAKHGHDRVAHRIAHLTGSTLDEVRAALIPIARRPYRYVYGCPGCGLRVPRKRRGTWSCSRCASHFDPRYVLRVVEVLGD